MTSCPTTGVPRRSSRRRRASAAGALGGDDAAVGAGDGQGERCAAARAGIVLEQRDADPCLGREPRLELVDAVRSTDLDAAGVHDRGGQGGRQVVGRDERAVRLCRPVGFVIGAGRRRRRGRPGDGIEVEPEL